ncbi:MAG: hypothetical protein ACNA8W_04700 [Bradymonadaceae bacterium]
MNISMQTYLNLVDGGRPVLEDTGHDCCHQAVVDLLIHALDQGSLRTEGVWRLDRREAYRLEDRTGYRPAGGWKKLCALAAGCGVVRAQADGFVAVGRLEDVEGWGMEETRRRLLEAFCRNLVPPGAAAGVFMVLGVHPLWGLRLAHRLHRPGGECLGLSTAEEKILLTLERTVFGALAGVFAALRQLEPGRRYGVDALCGLVGECCNLARKRAGQARQIANELAFIEDDESWDDFEANSRAQHRALDFTTEGLIASVLVPAGAIRRFDDSTFCVMDKAFDQICVGNLGEKEQNQWLAMVINGGARSLVA